MTTWLSLLVATEAFVMSIAFAGGAIANVAAIVVAVSSPNLRHTRIYVVNRAIADILFLLTVPLDVTSHLQDSWVFTSVICKFRCGVGLSSLLASSCFLVGMTAEVYVTLCRPQASKKCHSAMAKIWVALTWSTFLVVLLLLVIQSEILKEVTRDRYHCVSLPLSLDTLGGHVIRFLTVVFVCLVPLLVCWVLVRFIIKCHHVAGVPYDPDNPKTRGLWHPRNLQRCLVITFTMCHTPYWMPQFLNEILRPDLFSEATMIVYPAAMCLPAICAAVSPVLFLLSNKALKKRILSETALDVARVHPTIPLQVLSHHN